MYTVIRQLQCIYKEKNVYGQYLQKLLLEAVGSHQTKYVRIFNQITPRLNRYHWLHTLFVVFTIRGQHLRYKGKESVSSRESEDRELNINYINWERQFANCDPI